MLINKRWKESERRQTTRKEAMERLQNAKSNDCVVRLVGSTTLSNGTGAVPLRYSAATSVCRSDAQDAKLLVPRSQYGRMEKLDSAASARSADNRPISEPLNCSSSDGVSASSWPLGGKSVVSRHQPSARPNAHHSGSDGQLQLASTVGIEAPLLADSNKIQV